MEPIILPIFIVVVVVLIIIIIIYTVNRNQTTEHQETSVSSSVVVDNSVEMEAEVLSLVNDIRSKGATCGGVYKSPVPELEWNEQLARAAEDHSRDMADKNYFSHTSLNGRTFVTRITNAGYTGYTTLGENIAAGYSTANDVVNGWMNSPGHCNNIMNPSFKDLGVGYAYNSGSRYRNYWTQDFGRKR